MLLPAILNTIQLNKVTDVVKWFSFLFFLTLSGVLTAQDKQNVDKTRYQFAAIELLIEQEVGQQVLTKIYQNIDIDMSIAPLPAKRAQLVANSGYYDGEIMRIWTYGLENPNTIRVPTPYYYLETMAFVLKTSDIVINSEQDLSKYRLTKVRGVKHTNNITQGLSNVYEMSNSLSMFKLLLSGKVDVALTNKLDGNIILKDMQDTSITPMDDSLAKLPLYHYIHKKNAHLVPLVDAELKRLVANGELAKIVAAAEKDVISQHNKM